MSYLRDGITMLEEIAAIRWNALTGHYTRKIEEIDRGRAAK